MLIPKAVSKRRCRRIAQRHTRRLNLRKDNNKINRTFKRNIQSINDLCLKKFNLIADAQKTVRSNVKLFAFKLDEILPQPIQNDRIWNLCRDNTELPFDLEKLLSFNLGHGVCTKPDTSKLPIDIDRLRRSIRSKFLFKHTPNTDFDPKLYIRRNTELPWAPDAIENAVDEFAKGCRKAFDISWKRPMVRNVDDKQIELLKTIKAKRRFIIIGTDKNLGPVVIETKRYIARALQDHLNDKETYLEVTVDDARMMNEHNFR